uniref:Putative secreted protein n=1 Tax=Anopheles marajoara TaxID=58244 RepID=A0A2M4CDI2_9DIPT
MMLISLVRSLLLSEVRSKADQEWTEAKPLKDTRNCPSHSNTHTNTLALSTYRNRGEDTRTPREHRVTPPRRLI